jgi:hypothetical protein
MRLLVPEKCSIKAVKAGLKVRAGHGKWSGNGGERGAGGGEEAGIKSRRALTL